MKLEKELKIASIVLDIYELRDKFLRLEAVINVINDNVHKQLLVFLEKLTLKKITSRQGLVEIVHASRKIIEACLGCILVSARVGVPTKANLRTRINCVLYLRKFLGECCSDELNLRLKMWCLSINCSAPLLNRGSHANDEPINLEDTRRVAVIVYSTLIELQPLLTKLLKSIREACGIKSHFGSNTKLCAFFLSGFCDKENDCPYAHSYKEIKDSNCKNEISIKPNDKCGCGILLKDILEPGKCCCCKSITCHYCQITCINELCRHLFHKYDKHDVCSGGYSCSVCENAVCPCCWRNKTCQKCDAIKSKNKEKSNTPSHLKKREKTQLCHHWAKGYCKRSDKCMFAHGMHELKSKDKKLSEDL